MNVNHPSAGGAGSGSCRRTTVTRPGARFGFWSSSRVPSGLRVPPTTTSLTLIGFLRGQTMNVYSCPERIKESR